MEWFYYIMGYKNTIKTITKNYNIPYDYHLHNYKPINLERLHEITNTVINYQDTNIRKDRIFKTLFTTFAYTNNHTLTTISQYLKQRDHTYSRLLLTYTRPMLIKKVKCYIKLEQILKNEILNYDSFMLFNDKSNSSM